VELKMNNGQRIMIGSQQADELALALSRRIKD
jgi:hypothetical protein